VSEHQPSSGAPAVPTALSEEHRLRKDLGFWGLTAIGFSNILGSGWLFAAMLAAQTAGPAALLSWIAAGVLCALVALVMVELGATRPEGGGTVRWPLYASGRLVGTVIGWSVLLSVGGTAAEISAIMQYSAHYLPGLYNGSTLTASGLALAAGLSALLTALNWFAVRMFARLNNLVSLLKVVIPVLTVVALFLSGTHSGRLTDHGGFAPYGYAACLSALAGGGIVYSVNGFQAPLDFSGEARRPRRNVPAAVLAGIGLAVVVYLGLQLAFLFTVPESLLGHGWRGVDFESPFGQLALVLNLHWLATLLYVDAVLSPGGSAYVGVAIDARHTYALAKNRLLPRFFMRIDPRYGMPHRALLLNFLGIVVFLLPFGSWQNIVSVMGNLYLLIYAASAVAVAAFRAHERESGVPVSRGGGVIPGMRWIAPISFLVASEFIYWSGWHTLRLALPLVLAGVPLFLAQRRRAAGGPPVRDELRHGAWLVVHLAALTLLSWFGSFGGSGQLPAPYDTITVGALSLGIFAWAVRSGAAHLRAVPPPEPDLG
jgi:amino acid transporter